MANIYFEFISKNKFKIMLAYTKDYVYYAKFCENQNSRVEFQKFLNSKYKKVIKNRLKSYYGMLMENYFEGIQMQLEIPYKLNEKSKNINVWKEISKICYGDIKTYNEINEYLDNKLSQNAINKAIRENCLSVIIPTHRVINDSKMIYIDSYCDKIKIDLLKLEGHKIEKKGKKNGQKVLYIIKK